MSAYLSLMYGSGYVNLEVSLCTHVSEWECIVYVYVHVFVGLNERVSVCMGVSVCLHGCISVGGEDLNVCPGECVLVWRKTIWGEDIWGVYVHLCVHPFGCVSGCMGIGI